MEIWKNMEVDSGLRSEALIYNEPTLPEILEVVHEKSASLVAVSRRGNAERIVNDRFTKNLLKRSPVPVIVFSKSGQGAVRDHAPLFHHVILATDWSHASKVALEYFLLNFKGIIGILEIVNVINMRLSVRDIRTLRRKLEGTRKVFLDMGIDAESHIYAGRPPEEIVFAADDYKATSIVMGTASKPFVKSVFSKSCACMVARDAKVPVLVIPGRIEE
ncbi:MAG: universal stress protein [Deltaproteobacteria bacterium]|nr:universal stress protein [Deltaproteobacteria bacterium]